jgi:DNA processing protein
MTGDRGNGAVALASAGSGQLPERDALAVLVSVDGLGPVTLGRLVTRVGGPGRLLDLAAGPAARERLLDVASEPGRRSILDGGVADGIVRAAVDAPRILERIRAAGLQLVCLADADYPPRLREIELPPHVLFVAGDPGALLARRAVAVVGTRRPTEAGRRLAARVGGAIARLGAMVVSGLAVGIDGAAHAAVLAEGGTTVAVLGGGHGPLYPRAHARLADAIAASGGAVISELAPDVAPLPGTFPRRNRLISGLAEATVVIEAGARSGALTTAAWALEQGRECFLVPGPIDEPMSAGCLAFLREFAGAARIVAGVPQLIEDLRLQTDPVDPEAAAPQGKEAGAERRVRTASRPRGPAASAVLASLGAVERHVAKGLIEGLVTVDELVATTNHTVAAVLAALSLLEDRGLAAGAYGRYRPAGSLAAAP